MTCRLARSLLDAYLDSELSQEDHNQVTMHLSGCDQCQKEFESGSQLRDLLTKRPQPEPGLGYWDEVTRIILARTIENDPVSQNRSDKTGSNSNGHSILFRPLISVIASLGLLFAALFIGANKELIAPIANSPIVEEESLTAGIWMVNGESSYTISPEDELLLTRGILLLAPPGPLSRFDAANTMIEAE